MKPLTWQMVYIRDNRGHITHYLFYATQENIEEAIENLKNNKPLPKLFIGYKV